MGWDEDGCDGDGVGMGRILWGMVWVWGGQVVPMKLSIVEYTRGRKLRFRVCAKFTFFRTVHVSSHLDVHDNEYFVMQA